MGNYPQQKRFNSKIFFVKFFILNILKGFTRLESRRKKGVSGVNYTFFSANYSFFSANYSFFSANYSFTK
jgi:hypothetical protein